MAAGHGQVRPGVPAQVRVLQCFTGLSNGAHRFGKHPAGPSEFTAYTFRWATFDDFYRTSSRVRLTLDPQQLRWLGKRLSTARSNRSTVASRPPPVIGSSLPAVASSQLELEAVPAPPSGGCSSATTSTCLGEFHAVSVRATAWAYGSVPSYGNASSWSATSTPTGSSSPSNSSTRRW